MKMLLLALGILLGVPVWAATLPEGEVVHTATYTGVIFNPTMAKAGVLPVYMEKGIPTYWTPSKELIAKAEQAFRQELTKAYASIPPNGFYYQEWYTPKHYSRDRVRVVPINFFSEELYGSDPKEVATWLRQYTGVTISGTRLLLVNLIDKDGYGLPWKSQWVTLECTGTPEFYYDPQTGSLSLPPFYRF